ncbi:MAG: response regulator, partial [Planctomycetota bacterium]
IESAMRDCVDFWVWTAWSAESPEACKRALVRALEMDADHSVARAGLQWVDAILEWTRHDRVAGESEDGDELGRTQPINSASFLTEPDVELVCVGSVKSTKVPSKTTSADIDVSGEGISDNDGLDRKEMSKPIEAKRSSPKDGGLEAQILSQLASLMEETESQKSEASSTGQDAGLDTTPAADFDDDGLEGDRTKKLAFRPFLSSDRPFLSSDRLLRDQEATNASPIVLVVDNSPTVGKLIALTLEKIGYDVVTAADGVAALNFLAERLPDVILTEVSLPRLAGYKLCRLVKKHNRTRHIPVIMLSGKQGVFDRMRGQMVGCADTISKPFESHELVEKVRKHAPVNPRVR